MDLLHLRARQRPEFQRPGVFFDLRDAFETWNRNHDIAARPQPAQCALGERAPVAGQHVADRVEPFESLGLIAVFEIPAVPDVVGGQLGVGREFAGQNAHAQRPAQNAGQLVTLADLQRLRVAAKDVEALLNRRAVRALRPHFGALRVVGAPTNRAHFARSDQFLENRQNFGRLFQRIAAQMKLIQINVIGLEAAQTLFTGVPNVIGIVIFAGRLARGFDVGVTGFGGDHDLVALVAQRARG